MSGADVAYGTMRCGVLAEGVVLHDTRSTEPTFSAVLSQRAAQCEWYTMPAALKLWLLGPAEDDDDDEPQMMRTKSDAIPRSPPPSACAEQSNSAPAHIPCVSNCAWVVR